MSQNTSPATYHIGSCDFVAAQDAIFQAACVFFLIAIISPSTKVYGNLWLRVGLVVSNVLFATWGWLVLCAVDIFVWYFVLMVINIVQAALFFYSIRPVTLSSELEMVYETQFKKVGLPRLEFKKIADIAKLPKELSTESEYSIEGISTCDNISFLVWGRLKVSMQGVDLHKIYGENFIDSPEYLLYQTMEKSQVTITADMPSLYVSWDKKELLDVLNSNHKLRLAFEAVIAKDVTKKVMDTSYRMAKVYSLDSFPDLRTPNIETTVGSNDDRTVVHIDMKPKICGIKRSQSAGGNKKPLHGILRNKSKNGAFPRRHSTAVVYAANELENSVNFDPGKISTVTQFDAVKLWNVHGEEDDESEDSPECSVDEGRGVNANDEHQNNDRIDDNICTVEVVDSPDVEIGGQNVLDNDRTNTNDINSNVNSGIPEDSSLHEESSDILSDRTDGKGPTSHDNPVFTISDEEPDIVEHRIIDPRFHQPYLPSQHNKNHHHHHHNHHQNPREHTENTAL